MTSEEIVEVNKGLDTKLQVRCDHIKETSQLERYLYAVVHINTYRAVVHINTSQAGRFPLKASI
jgi:hypothetical protein